MRIRRCSILLLEPREETTFDLEALLGGGNGLHSEQSWLALAPHLDAPLKVSIEERELLGRLSPTEWVDTKALAGDGSTVRQLLKTGLLIARGKRHAAHRERDERLRETHWHPLAATFHAFTRWSTLDTVQGMRDSGTETPEQMRAAFGPPPVAAPSRGEASSSLSLPRAEPTAFDELLGRRVTCRNFDAARPLPRALFAQLLQRVFSVQAEVHACEDTVFVKKTSPSGGGLHPVEAYLLVQNVDGVAPGLYHYHALDHALELMSMPTLPLREFAMQAVAHQHWFADAHVLVVLAPRFDRTFWKYRHHAKAYRVIALEAGHLSQTLYLSATEAGLGAFITGAINEVPIEQALGLDPVRDGALAICGFGWRGEAMETAELDPVGAVWEAAAER
ncbi:putative peptide maturation dehydrogenase [Lysobacter sp. F60174L2]|uniref:putative peptide maturation dehydrogenase n=1 Tax=Lysobacter sp. F60174L2 TaxID=3459295 RepID=UPI00403DB384